MLLARLLDGLTVDRIVVSRSIYDSDTETSLDRAFRKKSSFAFSRTSRVSCPEARAQKTQKSAPPTAMPGTKDTSSHLQHHSNRHHEVCRRCRPRSCRFCSRLCSCFGLQVVDCSQGHGDSRRYVVNPSKCHEKYVFHRNLGTSRVIRALVDPTDH